MSKLDMIVPKDTFQIVPILYVLVPIILGFIISYSIKKSLSYYKILFSLILSVVTSIIYIEVIGMCYPDEGDTQLKIILYIWNSIIMFFSSLIYPTITNIYNHFKLHSKNRIK